MSNKFAQPMAVDDVTLAFPAGIAHLMPEYSSIPAEFKNRRNRWTEWQSEWFYSGLKRYPEPKDGIDVKAAMRHLGAIQDSYEPKHEHKEAAVAFLASQWFERP